MKYTRKDLGAYKLHLINTDKFKTIMIRVSFRMPIKKEEIKKSFISSDRGFIFFDYGLSKTKY